MHSVIAELWPDQYGIAGEKYLRNLIAGVEDGLGYDEIFERSEGGGSGDLASTLELLVEIATLLKLAIEIRETLGDGEGARREAEENAEKHPIFEKLKAHQDTIRKAIEKLFGDGSS